MNINKEDIKKISSLKKEDIERIKTLISKQEIREDIVKPAFESAVAAALAQILANIIDKSKEKSKNEQKIAPLGSLGSVFKSGIFDKKTGRASQGD